MRHLDLLEPLDLTKRAQPLNLKKPLTRHIKKKHKKKKLMCEKARTYTCIHYNFYIYILPINIGLYVSMNIYIYMYLMDFFKFRLHDVRAPNHPARPSNLGGGAQPQVTQVGELNQAI